MLPTERTGPPRGRARTRVRAGARRQEVVVIPSRVEPRTHRRPADKGLAEGTRDTPLWSAWSPCTSPLSTSTTRPTPSGWSTCSRPPTRSTGRGTRGTPRPRSRSWPRTAGTATPSCSSWAATPTGPSSPPARRSCPRATTSTPHWSGGRVVPDHRGQGIGSAFYDHLEGVAAAAGRTRFFTGGPESDAGRRFAESRGYAVASVGMTRRVDLGGGVRGGGPGGVRRGRAPRPGVRAGPARRTPAGGADGGVRRHGVRHQRRAAGRPGHRRRGLRRRPGPGVRAGPAVERTPALPGAGAAPRTPARSPGIPSSPSRPSGRTSATSTTRPSSARTVAIGSGCCSRPT